MRKKKTHSDKLKVLVLSRNMAYYAAAYYQRDFLEELKRQGDCFIYGPGFPDYDSGRNLTDVLRRAPFRPDVVFTGHSFLEDNPRMPLLTMPAIDLSQSTLPIFGFVNKEYSRLQEKLEFISNSNYSLVFTHHHSIGDLSPGFPTRHIFLPFGVNLSRFPIESRTKKYDLGFSGLLKNLTFGNLQTDTRKEVFDQLFVTLAGMKLKQRSAFSDLTISWNTWTGNRGLDFISSFLGRSRKMTTEEYRLALQTSRIWLNFPSPLDLVSTRYFEAMASGAVVLAQESRGVSSVFPRDLVRTFSGPSDFAHTLRKNIEDEEALRFTAQAAQDWVREKGTWESRVEALLREIAAIL
jgi:glycosyltransferase involved in cell wall biosynthesis